MTDSPSLRRPLSKKGTWHTYTTTDGLAALQVEHIVEDQEGYLWFATCSGGVSRFDGDEFRTFTTRDGLCSDLVYSMLCDRQGRLWFGTFDRGLCWYDGKEFHRFAEEEWISQRLINYIFEDGEGRIWVGGQSLGYYDGAVWRDLAPEYRRTCGHELSACWGITQDGNGHLWFGGVDLVRFDGSRFCRYGKEDGLLDEGHSCGVAVDGESNLWVGREDRIWRYDGHTFQPAPVEFEGGVRKIQQDREGRTWFCLTGAGGGVLCYDGAVFHHYSTRDGLAFDAVSGMLQDREGQFWFATWGGGVNCYDPYSIHSFGEKEGLPYSRVYTLMESRQGGIWMGFGNPLWDLSKPRSVGVFDGENFTPLDVDPGGCLALCEDRSGHLWVGSRQGLYCYDGHTLLKSYDGHTLLKMYLEGEDGGLDTLLKMYPEGDTEGFGIAAIASDEELFFGYTSRDHKFIICYDGQSFQTVFKEESGSFGFIGAITAIVKTRDRALWFGRGTVNAQTNGRGIGRLDESGEVSFLTEEDGLVDDRVEDLLEDREGVLWIATLGGISCFDGHQFRSFTLADGLPNNQVRCICEDRQGHLWFGTDGGVAVYDGQVFQTVHTGRVAPTNRIIEDRDGRLWFATPDGAVRYTPGRIPPRIRLLQVVADRIYPAGEQPRIAASTRQVSFEYKGMSFRTRPQDMFYTCKLEGYDQDWRHPVREMRVYYQDLPLGEYTFQVKAVDRDLNYSEPATVQITVVPDPHLAAMTEALSAGGPASKFVGRSQSLRQVERQIEQVARADVTVLILGETGTGKGLAARAVHHFSDRAHQPFIQINCGSLPESLVESELYGHEKGSFTGATARKIGKVEVAQGGTLFLDEIGDMPLDTQVKLLRLLEEGTFERVGGTRTLSADVRVVAATNRDLTEMVQQGAFREDLFFRLQVFPVDLPPLRARGDDIPLLAVYFMERMAAHLNKRVTGFSAEAFDLLRAHLWPGNVRELEHAVQRAVIVCEGEQIAPFDLAMEIPAHMAAAEPDQPSEPDRPSEPERPDPQEYERQYLRDALERAGGVIKGPRGAAALVGVAPSTLYYRLRKLGLRP